jgi:hypothetical protein
MVIRSAGDFRSFRFRDGLWDFLRIDLENVVECAVVFAAPSIPKNSTDMAAAASKRGVADGG